MDAECRVPTCRHLTVAYFVLYAMAAWVLPLELLSRWWLRRHGDALDRAAEVLRMEPEFGWEQRPFFSGVFEGVTVRTNELGLRDGSLGGFARAPKRVLILGPSSTFGWGTPEQQTYARRLERLLAGGPGSARVLNAGEIGYSTWQGLQFYRKRLRTLHPDITVAAYGANDVDRWRFFFAEGGADAEVLSKKKSAGRITIQNALRRLACLRIASRAVLGIAHHLRSPAIQTQGLRVPADEFRANLLELARLAREDGGRMILMTTAHRFIAPNGGAGRQSLAEAQRAEAVRVPMDLSLFNRIVREIAVKERIPLIDAEALLGGKDAAGLFLDPIHPSPAGHAVIAEALARAVIF